MSTPGPRKLVKPAPRPRPDRRPPSPVPNITIESSESDAVDELSKFFDGLSQWKALVSQLGPRFDQYVTQLDKIEETFISALEKTHKTAMLFAQLSDSMQLVNQIIELTDPRSANYSLLQDRIEQSLSRCDNMVQYCEECWSVFSNLNNELLAVQQDIQEDIIRCEREVKKQERSKKWLKVANRVSQVVTLVAAAAASLMGAFFAFGTPLVAIPLAFSVISPIISFNLNARIEASNNRAKKPKKELEAFIELENGISIGSERAHKMMHWWEDIRREIETLNAEVKQGSLRWGPEKTRTISTEQWQTVRERLDEHCDRLQRQLEARQPRRSRSPSPNSLSTAHSSSSRLSEHGYGSPTQSLSSLSRSSSRSSTCSTRSQHSVQSTRSHPGSVSVQKNVHDKSIPQAQTMSISWG